MKRILAVFMTVLMMSVNLTAVASAAEENTFSKFEWQKDLFIKLDIISSNDSVAEKSAEDKITRAEFAKLAFGLYNGTVKPTGSSYFKDVPSSMPESAAINSLAELGIISGVGNREFRPDENITFIDAVNVVTKIMGYSTYENMDYKTTAVDNCLRYGLLSRTFISNGKQTAEYLFETVYRLMQKELLAVSGVLKGYIEYEKTDESILSYYFDVYIAEGIMESDGFVNIYNPSNVSDSRIIVDGVSISNNNMYPYAMIGYNVDAFYKDYDDPQLIAICKNDKNRDIIVSADDINGFDNWKYSYFNASDRVKKINVDVKNATVIYNNELLTGFDEEKMIPDEGEIIFIDNNNDGKYDVINIKAYVSFAVENVYQTNDNYVITPKNIGADNVLIDTDKICIIRDADGNILTADSIGVNDVLSVISENSNGEAHAAEIIVSRAKQTVKIDSVLNDPEDGITIHSGSTDIKVNKTSGIEAYKLAIGSQTEAYLDFMGKIVYTESGNSLSNRAFGYLLNMTLSDEDGEDSLILKMYDELGRIERYTCNDTVKVDNVSCKTPERIYNALLKDGKVTEQLILFKVNAERKITQIDTPEDYSVDMETNDANTLIKMADDAGMNSGRGLFYTTSTMMFGGKIIVDNRTTILVVPKDTSSCVETDFEILTASELLNNMYYNVVGYTVDKDSPTCELIVVTRNGREIANEKYVSVITSIREGLNKDGEESYTVELYDIEGRHQFTAKDKSIVEKALGDVSSTSTTEYRIEVGDIVKYSIDSSGELNRLLLTYDYSEKSLITGDALGTSYTASSRTVMGIPYSINSGYLKVLPVTQDLGAIKANDFEMFSLSRFRRILKVEMGRGSKATVEDAAPDSVYTYKSFGSEYSNVIIHCQNRREAMMFIYE